MWQSLCISSTSRSLMCWTSTEGGAHTQCVNAWISDSSMIRSAYEPRPQWKLSTFARQARWCTQNTWWTVTHGDRKHVSESIGMLIESSPCFRYSPVCVHFGTGGSGRVLYSGCQMFWWWGVPVKCWICGNREGCELEGERRGRKGRKGKRVKWKR